tara:strand:- start:172 stop:417 length:246 start_codon:yes stop_codon:yes gene_type:complete
MVNYANVRSKVGDLLRSSERIHELEKSLNMTQKVEYSDSYKLGALTFALSTICFHVPQARKRLLRMLEVNEDAIAVLQKKR